MMTICMVIGAVVALSLCIPGLNRFHLRIIDWRAEQFCKACSRFPVIRYFVAAAFIGLGISLLKNPKVEDPEFMAVIMMVAAIILIIKGPGKPQTDLGVPSRKKMGRR